MVDTAENSPSVCITAFSKLNVVHYSYITNLEFVWHSCKSDMNLENKVY